MKKCMIILVSLYFLGFPLYRVLASYTSIEDYQQRVKKLEKGITEEEEALLRLKKRYAVIIKEKERLSRYLAERKEAIRQTVRSLEENLRKKRQGIISEQLDAWIKIHN